MLVRLRPYYFFNFVLVFVLVLLIVFWKDLVIFLLLFSIVFLLVVVVFGDLSIVEGIPWNIGSGPTIIVSLQVL